MGSSSHASNSITPTWLNGLRVQARIIGALMMRDVLSRFGHQGLGFFWLIGEPLLLTIGIMVLWSLTNMGHSGDVGVVPFALTGYTFVTLWRHVVFRSIHVMSNHASLSYHRGINYLDVIIARSVVEIVGLITAFFIAYLPLNLVGLCPDIADPLPLVFGFVLTGWFSLGVGMVLAGLSEMNEIVHYFISPVMYITIPVTGIFFMVDWLPIGTRNFMLWSPLVNCIEMIRSGLFGSDVTAHYSAIYVIICSSLMFSLGLAFCNFVSKRISQH